MRPAPASDPAEGEAAAPVRLRTGRMALLLLLLPLFGQFFHYMKGLPLLWSLSKAFPLLSLPLVVFLRTEAGLPMSRQVLFTFLWLTVVPSFAAIFYFHQDFFLGLTAQVKLLPMLYFFSFLGLLLKVRPTLAELEAAFLRCGVATLVLLVLLWALVPHSWYSGQYAFGSSPLFSVDSRGERIRMPMFFAIVATLYWYRRFLAGDGWRWLAGIAAGFLLTLLVVKTRAMVVGMAGVFAINALTHASPRQRLGLILLVPLALAGLFSFGYLGTMFSTESSSGFDVRWKTIVKAVSFLGLDPVRWTFGVGTISPVSSDSLFAYFDHFFFLADITWLGILFEYGLIGAGLLVLYELRGLLFYRQLRRVNDSLFLASLFDYIVYVLLISNLYPPTLSPGETALILAIFAYVWRLHLEDQAHADWEAPPR